MGAVAAVAAEVQELPLVAEAVAAAGTAPAAVEVEVHM